MERPIKLMLTIAFFGLMICIMVLFTLNNKGNFVNGDGSNLDVWNTVLGILLLISGLMCFYQFWKFGRELPNDKDDEDDGYVGI